MTAAAESTSESSAVKYVTAASIIDCTGAAAQKDPVIVLKGKRIDHIGTKDSIKIPQGADVLDCGLCTLIPGMMDIHLHTMMFNCLTFHNHRVAQWEITPELQQMYGVFHAQLCFDMGFTTLRDLGLNSQRGLLVAEACAIRDAFDAGILEGPRMFVAGLRHHHRLAPGANPAARGRPPRLPDRRRAVGTAQARAHQPSCRLRRHQGLPRLSLGAMASRYLAMNGNAARPSVINTSGGASRYFPERYSTVRSLCAWLGSRTNSM